MADEMDLVYEIRSWMEDGIAGREVMQFIERVRGLLVQREMGRFSDTGPGGIRSELEVMFANAARTKDMEQFFSSAAMALRTKLLWVFNPVYAEQFLREHPQPPAVDMWIRASLDPEAFRSYVIHAAIANYDWSAVDNCIYQIHGFIDRIQRETQFKDIPVPMWGMWLCKAIKHDEWRNAVRNHRFWIADMMLEHCFDKNRIELPK